MQWIGCFSTQLNTPQSVSNTVLLIPREVIVLCTDKQLAKWIIQSKCLQVQYMGCADVEPAARAERPDILVTIRREYGPFGVRVEADQGAYAIDGSGARDIPRCITSQRSKSFANMTNNQVSKSSAQPCRCTHTFFAVL